MLVLFIRYCYSVSVTSAMHYRNNEIVPLITLYTGCPRPPLKFRQPLWHNPLNMYLVTLYSILFTTRHWIVFVYNSDVNRYQLLLCSVFAEQGFSILLLFILQIENLHQSFKKCFMRKCLKNEIYRTKLIFNTYATENISRSY